MSGARLIKVYKTRRKQDMYLYVDYREDLDRVPEALLEQFGSPDLALTLSLTADRKLARADAAVVLEKIDAEGFYLQMPPTDGGVDAEIVAGARRPGEPPAQQDES